MRACTALFAAILMNADPAHADRCPAALHAESGAQTLPVVELFTSEGCSSCPPADAWFSTLESQRLVPLAFHVDYWDYIGWKDRFAEPRFAARQAEAVRRQGARVAFTPQILVDGRDAHRGLWDRDFKAAIGAVSGRAPRAHLRLGAALEGNMVHASLRADIPVPADRRTAEVYLALTERGLSSRIGAGENRGRSLSHDHVVRAFAGPLDAASESIRYPLALPRDAQAARMTLVAFVQDRASGQTLQAIALPLCAPAKP